MGAIEMSRQTRWINLDKQARQDLEQQIRKTKDRKTADRFRVILYKADRHSHREIAQRLQMGRNQVTKIVQRYRAGGLGALMTNNHQGSAPKLTAAQQQELKFELTTKIYHTAQQVIQFVQERWDLSYGLRGMHKLLKRLGFTYKKNRLVPGKADPEAQRQFVQWFDKLRAELGPDDRLYFGDAVHLKHNAEAGYAWSLIGEPHLIPTNSGRQRYNILGVYCTQTHEHLFMLTEDNINQDKVIELLKRLRDKHPGEGKIYLVLDNASYNKAHRVQEQANLNQITLKFLPPYSPNLNLIERLWKFMRKKFCKDKYRDTFAKFRKQLDTFFAELDQYHSELAELLTEKFELVPSSWQTPVSA
jgi:transposase